MKALANYAMRGRIQALSLSASFAVISLVLIPLSVIFTTLSAAVIALVTLRKGPSEGFLVAAGATVIITAVGMVVAKEVILGLAYAIAVWLPVLTISLVLRRTVSLSLAFFVAGLVAVVLVFAMHSSMQDPVAWWQENLAKMPTTELLGKEFVATSAKLMTGLLSASYFVTLASSVVLARWWQATLFNPGGFGSEFRGLRAGKVDSVIALATLMLAYFSGGLGSLLADIAIVLITVYSLPGLAFLHDWAKRTQANSLWLVLVYLLLAFAPQLMVLFTLVSIVDAYTDLRRYIKDKASPV
ncbi:MAG: hypothetical protein OEY38_02575 [Gammaproteobacteria bacterium]|nr:hypothetical protein [Gammaproteobacteria bacterium]